MSTSEAIGNNRLVEMLGAGEWRVRQAAFTSLQQQGAAILEALIEGTQHPNWRVRRGCVDLMDHLADNRCVDSLVRLLKDPVVAVRRLALHALSCQGCKVCPLQVDIVAHLLNLAKNDKSLRVRRAAVHQLGCQPTDIRIRKELEELQALATDKKLLWLIDWTLSQHT